MILQPEASRQIHHTLWIDLNLHLSQPSRIGRPIQLISTISRQGIIRIRRQVRIIDPLPLRHRRQSINTLLHLATPEGVLSRQRPGEVKIKRQRGFGVRVSGVGGFLAVTGEEGLDVVADVDAGVSGCEEAVDGGFVLDGFYEALGVACGADSVKCAARVGRGTGRRGFGEGGE